MFDKGEDGRWLLTSEQIGELQASEFKIGYDSARANVESALRRIERFDVPQRGDYGIASADAVKTVRAAL